MTSATRPPTVRHPGMLSFQRLDVYQRALEFLVLSVAATARLPRGHAELAVQLRDAAQSTVANIAEGAGRRTRTDAAHHYYMARGSAMESAAHLDVMKALGLIEGDRYEEGIHMLEGVVAMLTKMCGM